MYFVYIIECEDWSLYTGSSPDPRARFGKHKSGDGGKYTRSHKPVRLAYIEELKDKGEALKREIEIKSWDRKKKLDNARALRQSLRHEKQQESCGSG